MKTAFAIPSSERWIVGALAQAADRVFEATDAARLTAATFTDADCIRAWTASATLRRESKPVDPLSMAQTMGGDDAEAMSFLGDCMALVATVEHAQHHAGVIREAEVKRKLAAAGRDAVRGLEGGKISPEQFIEEMRQAAEEAEGGAVRDPLAEARSLADYAEAPIDPGQTLLGDRFLCRGGAMLIVGRSGMGKSSMSTQQDILWACGREAFGIRPATPLNVLTIQAENDAGDVTEMAGGVIVGLGLVEHEIEAVRERTRIVQVFEVGEMFLATVRRMLAAARRAGRPIDLLRIDPLMAFAGGDLVNPEVVATFCRTGLNKLAFDFNLGVVCVHHTPKLNKTSRPRIDGPEWIYFGSGSADLSNWARSILVVTDGAESGAGVFRFMAAKRGGRVGWRDADGRPEAERFFCHAKTDAGGMYWTEATAEQAAAARATAGVQAKPDALQVIAGKDTPTMQAHAERICRGGPLTAADFKRGVMGEFGINEKYAVTVSKWLTEGEGKPVKVVSLGKVKWHCLPWQVRELKSPRLAGVK